MKVVFDTNVIISALVTQGLAHRVFDLCLEHHQLCISPWIKEELISVIRRKFKVAQKDLNRISEFLENAFFIIEPQGEMPSVCKDQDDNNVLHIAGYISADLIITGDRDLLSLKKFRKCKIINPRTYMEKYHKIR